MGKRKSKNSRAKKSSGSSSCSSGVADIPEINHVLLSENTQTDLDCSMILHEIQDSISDIYREYIKDLKLRKQKRLELKVPTSETQHYNLVINPNYRASMREKIHELIKQNYTCTLKNIVDETLETFLQNLREFTEESEDKSRLLQVVYLHEVYHTLQNSILEVSKIVFRLYSPEEFSKISLKKFYDNILTKQKKLLAFAKTQDNTHYAASSIIKIYEDLDVLNKTGECRPKDFLYEVNSDIDDTSEEPVHSLPLEQLLVYINGTSIRKKNKNKFKKNFTDSTLDEEILEFENRLATAKPLQTKSAPVFSSDFLKSLRDRYLEVSRKLLNN
jgi:hypothetical protein